MEVASSFKKQMKKVRRSFLSRGSKEEEPEESEDLNLEYTFHFLTDSGGVRVISQYIGAVEKDRKIVVDPKYINLHMTITNTKIVDAFEKKTVVLNINDSNKKRLPWEYVLQRLESYGDSELGGWIQRLKFYMKLPLLIQDYFNMIHLNDPSVHASLRKIKAKINLACQEIESKYIYRKGVIFLNKGPPELLSVSFSPKFLKKMGYLPEDYITWIQNNKVPALYDKNIPNINAFIEGFFEGIHNQKKLDFLFEGKEYITLIDYKGGRKRPITGKYITILDPTAEGFLVYSYFIIRPNKSKSIRTLQSKKSFRFKQSLANEPSPTTSMDIIYQNKDENFNPIKIENIENKERKMSIEEIRSHFTQID